MAEPLSLETAITASWEEVGRLAAIAVIRTVLNYLLERDLNEFREREGKTAIGWQMSSPMRGHDNFVGCSLPASVPCALLRAPFERIARRLVAEPSAR